LLESTENYNRQIESSGGEVTEAEKSLLPRLKNPDDTEVIIVTLAETTPFYEAQRLSEDLKRAGTCRKMVGCQCKLFPDRDSKRISKNKSEGRSTLDSKGQ
jgi:arsenite-transporting ATPase